MGERQWRWLVVVVAALCWGPAALAQELRALTLDEGVRLALERNETLKMAAADHRRAQGQVGEMRAEGLPQFDLGLNYNHNWVLPTFVFDTPQGRNVVKIGTDENLAGSLRLRQNLYTGGRVRAGTSGAREQEAQAREAEREARQTVQAEVERGFYDLLHAQELVKVSALALERAQANLAQVTSLRQAGRVADYDLLRAQVQVASLRSDSTQAQNRCAIASLALKQTIGMPLDQPLEIAGGFRQETRLELGAVETLVQLGLEARPGLRQLEHQLRARQSQVKVEQSKALPAVDMLTTGQLQFQSNQFDLRADEVWRKNWSTAVSVQVPLFDGLRIHSRVVQAKQDTRRQEAEIARARQSAELEIRQAWMELAEARQRLQAQEGIVAQAAKGLAVADARYAGGAGTQLEILDAQLLLLQAQTQYAAAQRDQALALVGLERAVGVLGE